MHDFVDGVNNGYTRNFYVQTPAPLLLKRRGHLRSTFFNDFTTKEAVVFDQRPWAA